jgi:hypothetical protein
MRLLLVMMLVSHIAIADTLNPCDLALNACKDEVDAQATQILHLKQDVHDLQDKVVDEENSAPALPWFVYILIGAAGAITAGRVFK